MNANGAISAHEKVFKFQSMANFEFGENWHSHEIEKECTHTPSVIGAHRP